MSLFSSLSGFISNAIVGGDNPVHLPSAPAPLADVMSTASAMTSAFFSDSKPQQPPAAAAAKPSAAAKPPPSPTPNTQPPILSSSTLGGSTDRMSNQSRTSSTSSLSETTSSRSAAQGRPSMAPPPPQPAKNDGPDLGPEFSHLSAEERRQIQMVMARAAQMSDNRPPTGYVLRLSESARHM